MHTATPLCGFPKRWAEQFACAPCRWGRRPTRCTSYSRAMSAWRPASWRSHPRSALSTSLSMSPPPLAGVWHALQCTQHARYQHGCTGWLACKSCMCSTACTCPSVDCSADHNEQKVGFVLLTCLGMHSATHAAAAGHKTVAIQHCMARAAQEIRVRARLHHRCHGLHHAQAQAIQGAGDHPQLPRAAPAARRVRGPLRGHARGARASNLLPHTTALLQPCMLQCDPLAPLSGPC